MSKNRDWLIGWSVGVVLLFANFAVNAQNEVRLVEASKRQDWETVRALLEKGGADINVAQPDGATPLSWAVYWDNLDTVQRLLEAGANPDMGNDYGVTPLFLAIKNRSPAVVETLIEVEGGANSNVALWNGETPLMTAAKVGQVEVVSLLLDHGADVNTREPKRGQSALMWAISFGHSEAARVLIERGADVNAKTKMLDEEFQPMVLEGFNQNHVAITPHGGYTPLMFAALEGDRETSRLLLERGADVNSHNEDGSSLVLAAFAGHEDLALFLLEKGADPNIADVNGMTALHYAMREGLKPLHTFKMTSEKEEDNNKGVFLEIRDVYTVLPGANMYELAEALLVHGADPNARMKYPPPQLRVKPSNISRFNLTGATPLFLAAAAQDLRAMKILLEAGADPLIGTEVDRKTFDRETRVHTSDNQVLGNATPLMVAVGMGRMSGGQSFTPEQEKQALEAARMLVNLGADVNLATASGWTPLHAATLIGADTLVKFLVEEGAAINVRNGCGQSPLNLAQSTSTKGLNRVFKIPESTAKQLIALGANNALAAAPVGECVLGRASLEE